MPLSPSGSTASRSFLGRSYLVSWTGMEATPVLHIAKNTFSQRSSVRLQRAGGKALKGRSQCRRPKASSMLRHSGLFGSCTTILWRKTEARQECAMHPRFDFSSTHVTELMLHWASLGEHDMLHVCDGRSANLCRKLRRFSLHFRATSMQSAE